MDSSEEESRPCEEVWKEEVRNGRDMQKNAHWTWDEHSAREGLRIATFLSENLYYIFGKIIIINGISLTNS